MPTRAELMQKLRNADAAGDTYAASRIAQMIRTEDAKAYSLSGKDPKDMGYAEQLLGGAKQAWDRAAAGVEGLVPEAVKNLLPASGPFKGRIDPTQLEQGKQFVQQTGPASPAGGFAADVGMTLPGFGATGALTKGLPLTRRVLAQAATGGATGAALTPEDRGVSAALGAAGGGLGEFVGSALTRGPVKLSPDAKRVINTGVEPTLGDLMKEGGGTLQKTLGKGVRGVEKAADVRGLRMLTPLYWRRLEAWSKAQEKLKRLDTYLGADDMERAAGGNPLDDEVRAGMEMEKRALENIVTPPAKDLDWELIGNVASKGLPAAAAGHYFLPSVTATAAKTVGGAAAPLVMFPRTASKLATGRYDWQKALRENPMGIAPELGYETFEELSQ